MTKNLKYIQMRRSQNNRILSHIRVASSDQNSSLGDKKSPFLKVYSYNSGQNSASGSKVEQIAIQREGSRDYPAAKNPRDSGSRSSAQRFNHVLSLYDKGSSAKTLTQSDTKLLAPRFNLKSKEQLPEPPSSIKKSHPQATHAASYLSRVKEILTARKSSYKQSLFESKKSPRNHKVPNLFSSLKEEDLLKIYDMNTLDPFPRALPSPAKLHRQYTNVPNSPNNHTYGSVIEKDEELSGQDNTQDILDPPEAFIRRSVGSPSPPAQSPPPTSDPALFQDPRLQDLLVNLAQTLDNRDTKIDRLEYENRLLRADILLRIEETDQLRLKLASLGIS